MKIDLEEIIKKEKAKQKAEEQSGDKKSKKDKKDKKKKKGKIDDGSEDRSFKIADITFAYNNSELVKLL